VDTHTTPARWFVSDLPAVGDRVVAGTTVAARVEQAVVDSTWEVTRVNLSTGRGTVRPRVGGGPARQIVRGRWGWRLADGFATPVRFACPASEPVADEVAVEAPSEFTYEAVLLDEAPVPAPPAPCVSCGSQELACCGWEAELAEGVELAAQEDPAPGTCPCAVCGQDLDPVLLVGSPAGPVCVGCFAAQLAVPAA